MAIIKMKTFLAMGGYGFYVWIAYAAALILLGALFIFYYWQKRRLLK